MSRKGDLTHTHKLYKLHTAQHNCSTSNISTIFCLTCFVLTQHEGTIMSNNTPKTHSRSLHWNQPHTHHSHQAVPPCHVTGPGWGSCDVASTVAEQTGAWLCWCWSGCPCCPLEGSWWYYYCSGCCCWCCCHCRGSWSRWWGWMGRGGRCQSGDSPCSGAENTQWLAWKWTHKAADSFVISYQEN